MPVKKILIINYEFPPLGGGGGHASEQIARELVKKDYDVFVLTSLFKNLPKHEVRDGMNIYRVPTLRRFQEKCTVFEMFVFLVLSVFFAVKIYRQTRPQFVLSFFSLPCGPAALVLRWFYNVPYVVSLRGGDVPGFLPEQLGVYHRLTNWLTRLIWKNAHAVAANSRGLAELAGEFDSQKVIHVIPNGVDGRFFFERPLTLDPSPTEGRGEKILNILTVSRLSKQKKAERLLNVMSRLISQGHNHFRLDIVGDGPEKSKLVETARLLGLLDRFIFFHGWVERESLAEFYRRADVFTLASDYEGMPNAVLEAMASSLAIVATDAPGVRELVSHDENGWLVPAHSLTEFDTALLMLAGDPALLQKWQSRSYQLARNYTWENATAAYEKLFA